MNQPPSFGTNTSNVTFGCQYVASSESLTPNYALPHIDTRMLIDTSASINRGAPGRGLKVVRAFTNSWGGGFHGI